MIVYLGNKRIAMKDVLNLFRNRLTHNINIMVHSIK